MGTDKIDIKILPGASKGFFNVVVSPHNGKLPKEQIQSILGKYAQKSGVGVSTVYDPTQDILTMEGVPGQVIRPLCCQDYTRTVDMSGLNDSTLRFKMHQESRRQGFTIY